VMPTGFFVFPVKEWFPVRNQLVMVLLPA